MSRPNNTLRSEDQDDRLADFTDGVIEGRVQESASNMDEELLLLEQTVQRLKSAYPPFTLDKARVKQMNIRLKNRIKREEQNKEQPFWKRRLEALHTHPQVRVAAGILSILLIFLILSPLLSTAGSSTTATALTPAGGLLVVAGLAGVILFILWINRRK